MRTIVIAIAAMIMLFGLGFMSGSTSTAHHYEQRIAASMISKDEIEQIVQKDAQIADLNVQIKTEAKDRQIEIIKTEVVEKIVKSPPQQCEVSKDAPEVIVINPYYFDGDVVRLLNDARADSTDLSTEINDGASGKTSSVGVEELVVNDLEVVRLYHDLAVRHTALQSYVWKYQDEGYQFCKLVQ